MMLEVFSNLNDFGMLQSFLNLEFSMFIVIISCLHSWKTTHFLIFCLLSLADHPNQSPLWGSKAGLRNLGLCPWSLSGLSQWRFSSSSSSSFLQDNLFICLQCQVHSRIKILGFLLALICFQSSFVSLSMLFMWFLWERVQEAPWSDLGLSVVERCFSQPQIFSSTWVVTS